ncbi:hypothetical protein [Parasphingorhabdus sp.]|uniref:hypothetical protein n=1 Tax=Parasphingorhabdus sp. TaxID=2709688 RepID=UPI002F92EB64
MSEASEKCLLGKEQAKDLAEPYKPSNSQKEQPSEIGGIANSLLCAEDIVKVVMETGLIAPFFVGGGRNSRIKSAAYEGRIGDKAYIYNEQNELERIFDREVNDYLKVPRNQIVFVECDLEFRLPQFIALRFNLQIQHVHRGLLLGTGPLIDPGFWGKLCIPLHNLTDEDYFIPKDNGLIWLEFTKTTSSPAGIEHPVGRPPLGGGFMDDIEDFLHKASRQFGVKGVPIRSALPTMFNKSEKAAAKAERSATSMRNIGFVAGGAAIIGLIGLIIGIVGLWYSYYSDMSKQFEIVRPKIESLETEIKDHVTSIEKFGQEDSEVSSLIPDLANRLEQQSKQNERLQNTVDRLEKEIKLLKEER